MKQFFEKYTLWEDYLNGMYDPCSKSNEDTYIGMSIYLLTNCNLFLETCKSILIEWPISSSVNLTNKACNRKAWLGHAACSYKYKATEIHTRIAWSKLTVDQQNNANRIAELIIKKFEKDYEEKNKKIHHGMGIQMLLKWDS